MRWFNEVDCVLPDPDYLICYECREQMVVEGKAWEDMVTCPKCETEIELDPPDLNPLGYTYDKEGYKAEQTFDSPDIFILKSPYYTYAAYCSPCAPGAGHLESPLPKDEGVKTYCFGHDYFDNDIAPYDVYSVETNELIKPEQKQLRILQI